VPLLELSVLLLVIGEDDMPATSEKQKRLMDAAAHNKTFAKKVGVPQNVAKEYSEKSKGLKFKEGGDMKCGTKKMAMGGKAYAKGGGVEHKGKTKGKMVKMATGGMVGKASKRADGIATKGKTKCKVM
jgi:hypothetical protein